MAKRKNETTDPREYEDPTAPLVAPSADREGDVREYDDSAASARVAALEAAAEETADTITPHPDLFAARDELEKRFSTFRSRPAIASVASTAAVRGRDNIVGFGVGLRFVGSNPTGEVVAKVFVRKKVALSQLQADAQVPASISGVPIDVEAVGNVRKAMYDQVYDRPVPCGVSICNVNLDGSGTLGALVVLSNGKLCILSNNHVLALENDGQVGDPIIQPGNAEAGASPDQVIGHLEDFVTLNASGNQVDAAVAWTKKAWVSYKHVTYAITNPKPLKATIGMTVVKNGRTTEGTVGTITDVGVVMSVAYRPFPQGAEMRDQIKIMGIGGGMFATQGDSGSLVVSANSKQPVGLFFATNDDSSICFANDINLVMSALDISRFYIG